MLSLPPPCFGVAVGSESWVQSPPGSSHSLTGHGGDKVKCRNVGLKPGSPAELQNLEEPPHLSQGVEARL